MRRAGSIIAVVLFIIGLYFMTTYVSPDALKRIAEANRLEGAILLGFVMFGATVVAPIVSLPLVPMVAPFLGPFTTGVASYIGWSLGAFVAFFVGRRYGRPLVGRFMNLESLARYESLIPPRTGFALIVMLRMVIPVDILSYALALFSTVSFPTYAFATMVGIAWFSFAFPYLGDALVEHNYVLFTAVGVASLIMLAVSWRQARKGLREE